MFNTLKYVKKLEAVGLPREQAETHIQIVAELMNSELATQQNLKASELALHQDMKDLSTELRQEMKSIRLELKQDIAILEQKMLQSEQRMVIKLGSMMSIAIGVAFTIASMMG